LTKTLLARLQTTTVDYTVGYPGRKHDFLLVALRRVEYLTMSTTRQLPCLSLEAAKVAAAAAEEKAKQIGIGAIAHTTVRA
jgi:hypothetical protein